MVKFDKSLSMWMGDDEKNVQNDFFYYRPGTRHAMGGGGVSGIPFLKKKHIITSSSYT